MRLKRESLKASPENPLFGLAFLEPQHSPMHTCSFTVFSDNITSVSAPEAL